MSGFWEIEAAVSPASILVQDGSEELLVRVQIVDLENPLPRFSRSSWSRSLVRSP